MRPPTDGASDMTCHDFTGGITEYLEGSLELHQQLRAWFHLQVCPACRVGLRRMLQTLEALRRLPRKPAPPAVHAKLLEGFRAWSRPTA